MTDSMKGKKLMAEQLSWFFESIIGWFSPPVVSPKKGNTRS